MSREAVESVRRSIAGVKAVITSLSEDEWALPSGCSGWTVKDLVAHMSSNYKEVVDPSPPPAEPVAMPAEEAMEALVAPRKVWSNEQVRDEYLAHADGALAALTMLQDEPLASTLSALADLGTYPMHQLADAFAFDHYCHLHVDLLAPHGPIVRDLGPVDDALIGPAVVWMLAGVPQMQPGLHEYLTGRVRLVLTGPGATTVDLTRDGDTIVVGEPVGEPSVTVTSDAAEFVRWGTVRSPWRDACTITGDAHVAATFFDQLNIV